jgi:hypothetical protein
MLASSHPLISAAVMRLIIASLLFNSFLVAVAVWLTSTSLPLFLLAPPFVGVSTLEALWLRTSYGSSAARDAAGRRTSSPVIEVRSRPSIMDDTTGLYTRWYFERRIEEEAARCRRYKHSMAVVVLRLDVVERATLSLDGWKKRSLDAVGRAASIVREVDFSAALSH